MASNINFLPSSKPQVAGITISNSNQVSTVNDRVSKLLTQGISFPPNVETKKNKAFFQEKAEKYLARAEKISKEVESLQSYIVDLKNPEILDAILTQHLLEIAPKKLIKTIKKSLLRAFPEEGFKKFLNCPRILLQLKNLVGNTPLEHYLENQRKNLNAMREIAARYSRLAHHESNDISPFNPDWYEKTIAALKASISTSSEFNLSYILNEGIQQNDALPTSWDVFKLQQLQDFYTFLNSPSFSKEFIIEKFHKLDYELKEALGKAVWAACYTPNWPLFADHIIAKNPHILLDCKNVEGADIVVQMMNHFKAKITLQRFKPELANFAKKLESTNDEDEQFKLFQALPKFVREDLAYLVGQEYDDEYDARFSISNHGFNQIVMYPRILIEKSHPLATKFHLPILDAYRQILDPKIRFDIRSGIEQFVTERQLPNVPINCAITASDQTEAIPPHMRVAMVSAEFAGVISMGGLAPAVAGMARGYGTDDVCVILPKYDVINPKLILQEKEKYNVELNGQKHKVFKAKVNGITCYFIADDLFNVGYKHDGKPNNIYEGNDLEVKRRWTHFQSLAADLVYTLSKRDKNPVQLVHVHDAQTALVPKILEARHHEEWKLGITPATVLTFHNNNSPVVFDYPQALDLLSEIGLPPVSLNSLIEGLEDSDMNTTVSETFAKEAQTSLFGKGMERYTIINAKKKKLRGIVNGNSDGWNPKTDLQLKNWISQDGASMDLSYGPDDEDLPNKILLIRQQLVDYLKFHNLGNFDPTKPIFLYVGRYDAYQKGINKLPIIMEEALKNGAQFICIGLEPDSKADEILTQMEQFARQQNNQGVCIIRDFKRPDGRLYWQNGNVNLEDKSGVQGFGSLLRAAVDVGAFPSMFEPCGLVQGEMHRMGIETLATATGGFVDTIFTSGQNRNGYLFPRLPIWESPEQDAAIRESVRNVSQRNQEKLNALYINDLNKLEPYLTQKRIIMRNAAKSTWNSTFDGSLSPIDRYKLVYSKALENRQNRARIYLDIHALGSPGSPLIALNS